MVAFRSLNCRPTLNLHLLRKALVFLTALTIATGGFAATGAVAVPVFASCGGFEAVAYGSINGTLGEPLGSYTVFKQNCTTTQWTYVVAQGYSVVTACIDDNNHCAYASARVQSPTVQYYPGSKNLAYGGDTYYFQGYYDVGIFHQYY